MYVAGLRGNNLDVAELPVPGYPYVYVPCNYPGYRPYSLFDLMVINRTIAANFISSV